MDSKLIPIRVQSLQLFYNDVAILYANLEKQLIKEMQLCPMGKKDQINPKDPDGWIIKNLQRIYVPKSSDNDSKSNYAVLYMLDLQEDSKFEEPTIICAYLRFAGELNISRAIGDEEWNDQCFKTIVKNSIDWKLKGKTQHNSRVVRLALKQDKKVLDTITMFAVDVTTANSPEAVMSKLIEPIKAIKEGNISLVDFNYALPFPPELISSWGEE
jgi:hypothetical protein